MLRWIMFAWASLAALIMAALFLSAAATSSRVMGDNSIVFGFVSLLGLPAWLVIAALTVIGWNRISRRVLAIQNVPAVVALAAFCGVQVQWAR